MHCAGCVASVEGALLSTPGVHRATVNLATERARLAVDPTATNVIQQVTDAVRAAGYDAVLHDSDVTGPSRAQQRARDLAIQKRRIILAAVFGLPLIVTHLAGVLFSSRVNSEVSTFMHGAAGLVLQAGFSVMTLLFAAGNMVRGAWRAARTGTLNMDSLVTLGAGVAFFASIYGALAHVHELLLFETAAMIGLFVGLGKYIEARARGGASAALEALAARLPSEALLRRADGSTESVPVDEVCPGDALRVPSQSIVPVDGALSSGTVSIDESLVTGESVPITKFAGDRLLSGTLVVDGVADITALTTGSDSTAARIARLVEEAQGIKPPWQHLADRVAARFTPVVLGLALVALLGWWWIGRADLSSALVRAITVLVVACPCAMGLAIPTAVLVGTSTAARLGILVRDPAALEAAAAVRQVVMDKTGTLTLGRPKLLRIESSIDDAKALALAAAVARMSLHPFSKAIVETAQARGISIRDAGGFESAPGQGIAGNVDGNLVLLGSAAWLAQRSVARVVTGDAGAISTVELAVDGVWTARFVLADELHPDARETVRRLHALGVSTQILSGDQSAIVGEVAKQLGVDGWRAGCLPQDKLDWIRDASRKHPLAFVGDGINDAPALAAAQVGIAIGTGADVAREAADICIVGHSPLRIPDAIQLSRRSTSIMRQNLGWAVGYNVLMLPLAMSTTLPAEFAAAAMMFSSFSVVLNSLRLRRGPDGLPQTNA